MTYSTGAGEGKDYLMEYKKGINHSIIEQTRTLKVHVNLTTALVLFRLLEFVLCLVLKITGIITLA